MVTSAQPVSLDLLDLRVYRRVGFNGKTRAHNVAVAIDVVNTTDGRPELVLARPRRRKGGLLRGCKADPTGQR